MPPHDSRSLRVALIPGDGIGPEVVAEAVNALRAVGRVFGQTIELETFPYGADYFLQTGISMPPDAFRLFREQFDAVLLGAIGDPRVRDLQYARDILLGIRFELDLFVNYRPVRLLDPALCPLKDPAAARMDFVVLRENTEGVYVNVGGRFKAGTEDEIAVQEEVNTFKGVNRIIRYAFERARATGRTRVCMSDKSNAMNLGHALWQRVFKQVAGEFTGIQASHLYIDALALQLVQAPAAFEIIVTNNLFGDIVTDLAAGLQGGLGVAASGNIHPGRTSMFEPVHGSAPPLAGRNVANPIGAVLSAALMLEFLGCKDEAAAIEAAATQAVRDGHVTPDLGGRLGTREVGAFIARAIESQVQG
jgi:3-isopropylmalate dehydrogenase